MQKNYLFCQKLTPSFPGTTLPRGDEEPHDWELVKEAMWRRAMGEDSSNSDDDADGADHGGLSVML